MQRRDNNPALFRKKIFLTGLAFIALVVIITSLFGEKGLFEIYQAKKREKKLLLEVSELSQRKQRLLRDIWELENSPQAVEKKAREKLGLLKPDEIVIITK